MISMRRQAGRRCRGQAIVEFAIVFPVFILLVLMLVDFGRAIWYYNAISNGAREGARTAIIRTRTDTEIRTLVKEKALGVPLADGDITISPSGTRTARQPVEVYITYVFTPITPMVGTLIGGSLTLESSSSMLVEY